MVHLDFLLQVQPASREQRTCRVCAALFTSRNQLFQHLKERVPGLGYWALNPSLYFNIDYDYEPCPAENSKKDSGHDDASDQEPEAKVPPLLETSEPGQNTPGFPTEFGNHALHSYYVP